MSSKSKPPPPFAQGTDVSVSKSRVEIETLLARHGSSQFMTGTDAVRGISFVGFTLADRQFRIVITKRAPTRRAFSSRKQAKSASPEQLEREQWRALLLVLKAKLEIIARGDTTPEREFLADLVLPDGSRVGDALAPKIAEAYATGCMPRLLGEGS